MIICTLQFTRFTTTVDLTSFLPMLRAQQLARSFRRLRAVPLELDSGHCSHGRQKTYQSRQSRIRNSTALNDNDRCFQIFAEAVFFICDTQPGQRLTKTLEVQVAEFSYATVR